MARSPAAPPERLGLHHLAHLRAVAEGLSVAESARRFLAIDHGNEALAAHRKAVEQVAATARRRGDSRWRLIGIEIRPVEASGTPPPPLDAWAEAEGLADLRESELQELYVERFGDADTDVLRRQQRNARLRDKRLALLRELEALAAEQARPDDRLDGWLAAPVAEALRDAGAFTLADLRQRIARGGRWWKGLPGFGPVKAARLAERVETLLGEAPSPAWPLALDAAVLPTLSGRNGANRAVGGPAAIEAEDDRAAVRAWVAARSGSPATARQYEREAERFILWCVLERGKALADATAEDCRAYMDFLADVPERWIGRRRVDRLAPGWAPFKGSLSLVSQKAAIAALYSLFAWLVQARYLASNPWVLVNRKLGDDAGRLGDDDDVTSRAFTPAAWRVLLAHVGECERSPSAERLRWLCVFVECTGRRAAELLGARREHLHRAGPGWVLRVHGKGRKNRSVPVPARAVEATRAYFEERGFDLDAAPPQVPLLGALADPAVPIRYSALHNTFTRFVRRALKDSRLPEAERQRLLKASAHWLRHTHATRAAEREVPLDVLQENLGQADPRTTARYYRAQILRRQKEMERAFAEGAADER